MLALLLTAVGCAGLGKCYRFCRSCCRDKPQDPSCTACPPENCDCSDEVRFQPKWYPAKGGYSPRMDDWEVRKHACHCARRSLREFKKTRDIDVTSHFADGYKAAYQEMAQGGSGATPPVPPEKYWAASYRTPRGHQKATEWFQGYNMGAIHAERDGIKAFNTIPVSHIARDPELFTYQALPEIGTHTVGQRAVTSPLPWHDEDGPGPVFPTQTPTDFRPAPAPAVVPYKPTPRPRETGFRPPAARQSDSPVNPFAMGYRSGRR